MKPSPSENEILKSQQSSAGDYIAENAPHWKAEAFIPATVTEMKQVLLRRYVDPEGEEDELDSDDESGQMLSQVFETLTSILNHEYRNLHQQLESHYAALDPDRDLRLIESPTDRQRASSTGHMLGYLGDVLRAANFTKLDEAELREAMKVASDWGVRLNIDFELFEVMAVYCRGDVFGTRVKRDWRRFWRNTEVEIPIYQRLVAIYKIEKEAELRHGWREAGLEHDRLYLSMFKNIPQDDVDMLLPGSSIKFSWLDRTKIFAPTVSGIGVTIFKIVRGAVVIAATGLAAMYSIAVLVAGIVGYGIKSIFSYLNTKDKYMLSMTRSLYFQKLDSNAGVIYRLLQEARQQDLMEVIIGYYVLHNFAEPVTRRALRGACQELLKDVLEIDIRFDIDSAINRLSKIGIAVEGGGDTWAVLSLEATLVQLNHYWDELVLSASAVRSQ